MRPRAENRSAQHLPAGKSALWQVQKVARSLILHNAPMRPHENANLMAITVRLYVAVSGTCGMELPYTTRRAFCLAVAGFCPVCSTNAIFDGAVGAHMACTTWNSSGSALRNAPVAHRLSNSAWVPPSNLLSSPELFTTTLKPTVVGFKRPAIVVCVLQLVCCTSALL